MAATSAPSGTTDSAALAAATLGGRRQAAGSASARRGWPCTVIATVVLTVSDDGPGIPEAERERVFERFVRLDEARSRATGGAGLGLTIVRGLVDRLGGRVRAGAAPGGGARFVVRLPAAPQLRN
jgi:signal transduction histidine kinase